ncbi:MAG: hypothetical protein JSU70_19305 [Phycisphaerales bacterium]|nr:MAG: hypothetical protein JSU70_19305 [Phycisphaerales bacterium]
MPNKTQKAEKVSKNDSAKTAQNAKSSGSPPADLREIVLVAAYLILMSVFLIYVIVQLWPHAHPPGQPHGFSARVDFLCWKLDVGDEARLLLIVAFAGALGGQVRSLRSIAWYVGNKELKKSWLLQYLLTPFVGATLALVFYFVIRGGFFSPRATTEQMSIYGFTGLAGLVGIASEPASLKLKKIAETLFTKPKEGKDASSQEQQT